MKAFRPRIHRLRRAQSLIDYVTLVGIVAAALIAMSVYMQRGVQSAVEFAADELGSQKGMVSDPNMANPLGVKADVMTQRGQMNSTANLDKTVSDRPGGTRTTTYNRDATKSDGVSISTSTHYDYE